MTTASVHFHLPPLIPRSRRVWSQLRIYSFTASSLVYGGRTDTVTSPGPATDRGDYEVFWVSTTRPDGRPHARPVWGVWVDGALHCGGGEQTRWVRNLAADPRLTVHTESGTDVVILDGVAERLDQETTDTETLSRIDDAYEAKYDVRHGTPVFRIQPKRVFAWSEFPSDATRWRFDTV